jgi:Flp pilus assembly protein TadG
MKAKEFRMLPAARIRRREGGAAAVEFALVVPFLMLVLFGLVTTGLAYSDHLSITNAVREGGRFGAGIDYTSSGWATSVRDRVKQVYFNAGSTITDAQICVEAVDSSYATIGTAWTGNSCGSAPSLAGFTMTSGSCAVVVWVTKPETIQLVVAPSLSFDIGAKSISYYGLTTGTTCTAS